MSTPIQHIKHVLGCESNQITGCVLLCSRTHAKSSMIAPVLCKFRDATLDVLFCLLPTQHSRPRQSLAWLTTCKASSWAWSSSSAGRRPGPAMTPPAPGGSPCPGGPGRCVSAGGHPSPRIRICMGQMQAYRASKVSRVTYHVTVQCNITTCFTHLQLHLYTCDIRRQARQRAWYDKENTYKRTLHQMQVCAGLSLL